MCAKQNVEAEKCRVPDSIVHLTICGFPLTPDTNHCNRSTQCTLWNVINLALLFWCISGRRRKLLMFEVSVWLKQFPQHPGIKLVSRKSSGRHAGVVSLCFPRHCFQWQRTNIWVAYFTHFPYSDVGFLKWVPRFDFVRLVDEKFACDLRQKARATRRCAPYHWFQFTLYVAVQNLMVKEAAAPNKTKEMKRFCSRKNLLQTPQAVWETNKVHAWLGKDFHANFVPCVCRLGLQTGQNEKTPRKVDCWDVRRITFHSPRGCDSGTRERHQTPASRSLGFPLQWSVLHPALSHPHHFPTVGLWGKHFQPSKWGVKSGHHSFANARKF